MAGGKMPVAFLKHRYDGSFLLAFKENPAIGASYQLSFLGYADKPSQGPLVWTSEILGNCNRGQNDLIQLGWHESVNPKPLPHQVET